MCMSDGRPDAGPDGHQSEGAYLFSWRQLYACQLCFLLPATEASHALLEQTVLSKGLSQPQHTLRLVALQFIEEPLADPAGLAAFQEASGMPVALDESLDDIIRALPRACRLPAAAPCSFQQLLKSGNGVTTLVVKPSVVGGMSASLQIARWGWALGLQARAQALQLHGAQPAVLIVGLGLEVLQKQREADGAGRWGCRHGARLCSCMVFGLLGCSTWCHCAAHLELLRSSIFVLDQASALERHSM